MSNTNILNNKNFKRYLSEVQSWVANSSNNGNLEFAINNGFLIHGVSLWLSTGASQYNLPLDIPRELEEEEVNRLLEFADIFTCSDCNHSSYFCPGDINDDEIDCESCSAMMKRNIDFSS